MVLSGAAVDLRPVQSILLLPRNAHHRQQRVFIGAHRRARVAPPRPGRCQRCRADCGNCNPGPVLPQSDDFGGKMPGSARAVQQHPVGYRWCDKRQKPGAIDNYCGDAKPGRHANGNTIRPGEVQYIAEPGHRDAIQQGLRRATAIANIDKPGLARRPSRCRADGIGRQSMKSAGAGQPRGGAARQHDRRRRRRRWFPWQRLDAQQRRQCRDVPQRAQSRRRCRGAGLRPGHKNMHAGRVSRVRTALATPGRHRPACRLPAPQPASALRQALLRTPRPRSRCRPRS